MFPEGNDRWSRLVPPGRARPRRVRGVRMVRSPVDVAARPAQEGRGRRRRERRAAGGQAHRRPPARARRTPSRPSRRTTSPSSQTLADEIAEGRTETLEEPELGPRCSGCTPTASRPPRQARSRSTSIPSGDGSAPGTSSSRARPLHPRTGPADVARRDRSPRLRRRRSGSTCSTSRRSTRSASSTARVATTRVEAAPDDVGSPWGIADHLAVHPDLGTVDDVHDARRRMSRARARAGARHRLPVHARSPVGDRASRVVRHPRRRHDPVRREPAQEVPGHLSPQLRVRGLGGAVERAGRGHPVLDRPGHHDLPRRQPAHQGVPVLGVGDGDDPQRAPRDDLPRRGVHPPAGDGAARQGRLQPVVHVLRVAAVGVGAARVLHRPRHPHRRLLPARTRGRTRPTSSPSNCSTAGGRCSSTGRSSPPR